MPGTARPLAVVLLFAAAVALLLAASAISPAAAAGGGGGRMVIIRVPPGTTTTTSSAAGARSSRWQQRVEDEVAPEFGAMLATNGRSVASGALIASKAVCIHNCGGRSGRPYTRPCDYMHMSQGCMER